MNDPSPRSWEKRCNNGCFYSNRGAFFTDPLPMRG
jgi:hypothetical protein